MEHDKFLQFSGLRGGSKVAWAIIIYMTKVAVAVRCRTKVVVAVKKRVAVSARWVLGMAMGRLGGWWQWQRGRC